MKNHINFLEKAKEHSRLASQYRSQAIEIDEKLNKLKITRDGLKKITKSSLAFAATLIFILCSSAEIFLTYPAYQDLFSENESVANNKFTGILGASIMVLMASVASHLFSIVFIKRVKDFYLTEELKSGFILEEAHSNIRKKVIRHLFLGIILSAFTIFGTYQLSFNRITKLGIINSEVYTDMNTFLPVIFITLEIIFGIYALYIFKRISIEFLIWTYSKRLKNLKEKNQTFNRFAIIYFEKSQIENAPSIELLEAIYIYNNRSIHHDDFLAPIEKKALIESSQFSNNGITTKKYLLS